MVAYQALFCAVILLDCWIAVRCFQMKNANGKHLGKIMSLGVGISLCYLLAISSQSYFWNSFFSSGLFIGIDYVLILLFYFVIRFIKVPRRLQKWKTVRMALWLYAAADTVILCINPFYEIALSYETINRDTYVVYHYLPGILYRCHLIYCYILLALTIGTLLWKCAHTPQMYCSKYMRIINSLLATIGLNMLFLFGGSRFEFDVSICFYSLCGAMVYINVFHYLERETLIQTREMLMEHCGMKIAFFDYEGYLLDCNLEMQQIFPELNKNLEDPIRLEDFLKQRKMPLFQGKNQIYEWKDKNGKEERNYCCEISGLKDRHNALVGSTLIMRDTTYMKDMITGLELSGGMLKYLSELDRERVYPIQLLAVNVNGLNVINHALGREKGNEVMIRTVEKMREILPEGTYMAKMENGSFLAVLLQTTYERARELAQKLKEEPLSVPTMNLTFELEYGLAEIGEKDEDIFDGIQEAMESLKNRKLLSDSSQTSSVIHSLSQTLLESDYETEEHVLRTRDAAMELGGCMGLSDKDIGRLALLSILHDIGKIAIPQNILLKPGRLDAEEWEIMKTHTSKGYRIAKASPELEAIAELILHHHEKWDGTGYPSGLKGEEIPLLSRIITVVDSYDVMVHDRPYHKAISEAEAREELMRCAGTQFDPKIVEAYLELLKKKDTADAT